MHSWYNVCSDCVFLHLISQCRRVDYPLPLCGWISMTYDTRRSLSTAHCTPTVPHTAHQRM
eukprot:2808603-Rhodomonas_salina.3